MNAETTTPSAGANTSPYDVADHLRTPEDMAAYLDAWLEDAADDISGIARALGDLARAKGTSQVARDTGLSRESLYRALSENGNPSFGTVLKGGAGAGCEAACGGNVNHSPTSENTAP